MSSKFTWLDSYFYNPNLIQKCLAFLLLPLSALYLVLAILNSKFRKKQDFKIPMISVGNLTVGGSGKTPMCKAIAKFLKKECLKQEIYIVLRGYKRQSKGLKVIKFKDEILCSVNESGDEAMEYAYCEDISCVIVSENRSKGILEAKKLGAQVILLDDAFSKFHIKKFDILLENTIRPYFNFTLPSGAYRLPLCYKKNADFVALEGDDFLRYSMCKENMKAILVTAIAKPFRLYEHFIKARACYFFKDHYKFKKEELQNLLKKHNCDTLMLTFKDFVKVKDMGFKTQIIELNIELKDRLKNAIKKYIKDSDEACKN